MFSITFRAHGVYSIGQLEAADLEQLLRQVWADSPVPTAFDDIGRYWRSAGAPIADRLFDLVSRLLGDRLDACWDPERQLFIVAIPTGSADGAVDAAGSKRGRAGFETQQPMPGNSFAVAVGTAVPQHTGPELQPNGVIQSIYHERQASLMLPWL
jgi:hypothetical protein